MARKLILSGFMSSLLLLSVIAYSLPAFAQGPDSNGKPEVVGISGIVPGKDLIVHVLVVVNPGEDKNQKALAALAQQGARPFTPHEFTTISLKWDQFSDGIAGNDFVEQNYNKKNAPVTRSAWTNTHSTWNNVASSSFVYVDAGDTSRCPSLVQECRGPQKFDGNNDVAWMRLSNPSTLGVTWTGTSTDEADMALNTSFNWNGGYDAETVFLHEQGHALGLGHSETTDAVMYAYYQGTDRSLHQDDINGITDLYPNNSPVIPPTLDGISLSPQNGDVDVGSFIQFALTKDYSDDTHVVVTDSIIWSSSNSAAASIDQNGSAKGESVGSSTITAEYQGSYYNTSLTINSIQETPSVLAVVSYDTDGGRQGDKHLIVTVTLDPPLSGASVTAELLLGGNSIGSATGTTNTNGVAGFTIKNASPGYYTTNVSVNEISLTAEETTDPGFTKQT